MMDDMRFHTMLTENYLKSLKRGYKLLIGMLVFLVAIAVYDFYALYYHPLTPTTLICIGAILGNIVWFFGELFLVIIEIKSEQRSLNSYKYFGQQKEYTDSLKIMEDREKYYKQVTQNWTDFGNSQKTATANDHESKPKE